MPTESSTITKARFRVACFAVPLTVAVLAPVAVAQPGGQRAQGAGIGREQMWPAPTAEDWKKPVLVRWQRTWEDALAISKETGKPILICVNMDGEPASEHYAGIRYRQPKKAKLYEPYVTVIASVYRHSPRDYDEHGQRILCPRFGDVTCGEHIAIEPILYEKFFDGTRVAPRHIMVEVDGKETYDIYYAMDTDSVFNAIRDGIAKRQATPRTIVRGDRTVIERVASRDNRDRTVVEKAYQAGDRDLRRRLLEAALEHVESAPDNLLRLAVFGFDTDLSRLARRALSKSTSTGAIDVINEALRVPMEGKERESLIAALGRLGESSRQARTLAVVHRGLGVRSKTVDVDGWSRAFAGGEYPAPKDRETLETRIAEGEKLLKSSSKDIGTRLDVAEATLALALDPKAARVPAGARGAVRDYARLVCEDARTAALEAEKLGATGWRVHATIALAAKYLGNLHEAHARAIAAVNGMPKEAKKDWKAIAVLTLFAEARQQAIVDAWRARQDWPGVWLTDVHSAYAVIVRHPLGTGTHVVNHYDFLKWLGAVRQASRCIEDGLKRFPNSWVLHDRLRSRILEEKGVDGLEPAYEAMLEKEGASRSLAWFAGYTSIVAAEFHRRAGDRKKALAAYDRAISHYERNTKANPSSRAATDHYIALAMAGQARIHFERGDPEGALAKLVASFERKPSAAATLDGLSISPADTARMLRAKFVELERKDLSTKLEAALAKLDPELLRLPAYEGQRAPTSGGRTRRR